MALIHCPECKTEVSNKAPSCPKCAYPVSRLTSLPDAILKKIPDIVEDVLKSGADVNAPTQNGNTPLHVAAAVGDAKIIQTLLNAGAIPQAKNQAGESPLDVARKRHRKDAIVLLQGLLPQATPEVVRKPAVEDEGVIRVIKKTRSGEEVVRDLHSRPAVVASALGCTNCAHPINGADVTCPNCKTLIVRKYCARCKKLYPDHALTCPHCGASADTRFRYHRHPEAYLAGVIALIVLSVTLALNWDRGTQKPKNKAQSTIAQNLSATAHAEPRTQEIRPSAVPQYQGSEQDFGVLKEQQTDLIPDQTDQEQEEANTASPVDTNEEISAPKQDQVQDMAPQREENPVFKGRQESSINGSVEEDAIRQEEPEEELPPPNDEPTRQQANSRGRALNDLGYRLLRSGRPERAIPVLYSALKAFPRGTKDLHYAYTLFNLGRSLRLAGRPDLAIPVLRERLKIRDQRPVVLAELKAAERALGYSDQVQVWTQ